jgi:prevent-host-death family protein
MTVRRVGVHEAKTHLSRLLIEVERGDEIMLTRGGKPIARIVGLGGTVEPKNSYGIFEGQFAIDDSFDADDGDLADLFGVPR